MANVKKWNVHLTRTITSDVTVTVEAEDESTAQSIALGACECGDYDRKGVVDADECSEEESFELHEVEEVDPD